MNWQTLGSGSSARTHKFSYFFAGEIDTSVVSAHTVQVQNRSQNFGTVYIYRESPDPGVFSVAMMSMQLAPEQRWIFRWSETYDFFTSMTELIPGVQLTPWQTVGASLTGNNLVTLTTTGFFPSSLGPPNALTILSNSPSSTQFTVGIGISGYPAYASQIFPFSLQSFHPTGAYYIAFSPYLEAGTVLSPSVLNKAQLTGSTVTAVNTPDQVWTVTPGSGF